MGARCSQETDREGVSSYLRVQLCLLKRFEVRLRMQSAERDGAGGVVRVLRALLGGLGIVRRWLILIPVMALAAAAHPAWASGFGINKGTSIFSPDSTPARDIFHLAMFVLSITGAIFVTMATLIVYAIIRYRARPGDDTEPPQVFGSNQIEASWTIIPILIVLVLFLATARMIFAIQDAPKPKDALDVTVIGHQFWWEFRYPKLGIVTANELHVPVKRATYLALSSADVAHSFWVPRLSGKTDLWPNRVNYLWIDPQNTGLFLGQCAQLCGEEHAKMLLRVYVDTPEQFEAWVQDQKQSAHLDPAVVAGRREFESESCINCHTVAGTVADGRFGPDLTHLMSRDTIASGAVTNTPDHLFRWIESPDAFKPGALMPPLHLSQQQYSDITAYLSTLK
jgi:cytochrome c oxidase subunit 2